MKDLELVFREDDTELTDSIIIAQVFEKRHRDLIRKIKSNNFSKEFNERNFAPIEYKDSRGRKQTKYAVTKDGFYALVFGFTGAKADEFKEMFINEFNRLRLENEQYKKRELEYYKKSTDELIEERDKNKWWLND